VGISAWASARMRVLRRPISAVSRPTARTRRSSDARARLPNSTGVSPEGATSGSRARVSASMPLLSACRARNRRRSAALAEVTRSTACPRRPKNTAIGSHAGPVGSMTTTSRVAGSAPASALASRAVRLSTLDRARRRAQTLPVLSSTTAACSLVTPRSRPSKRTGDGSCIATPSQGDEPAHTPRRAQRGRRSPTTVQVLATLPGPQAWHGSHSCAAAGPGRNQPAHFPQTAPWQVPRRQSTARDDPESRTSQSRTSGASPDQPGSCAPGTLAAINYQGSLHEPVAHHLPGGGRDGGDAGQHGKRGLRA
jgi:hypothetical protein